MRPEHGGDVAVRIIARDCSRVFDNGVGTKRTDWTTYLSTPPPPPRAAQLGHLGERLEELGERHPHDTTERRHGIHGHASGTALNPAHEHRMKAGLVRKTLLGEPVVVP